MTFTLDHYEPIAFHTYPALMRAGEAGTEVLSPAARAARAAPTVPVEPADAPTVPAQPVAAPRRPTEPVDAYLVGIDATAVLREQLADFLDAAGTRQDVRVSVGVSGESSVEWVLRDAVPYGVRSLPRYPPQTSAGDPEAVLEAVGTALADDALGAPERRRLVVLIWGRRPVPIRLPGPLASALVLHCVDAMLDEPPPDGQGPSWLLARSRPRPSRSLTAQAGRLLTGWEAFTEELPSGMVLTRFG